MCRWHGVWYIEQRQFSTSWNDEQAAPPDNSHHHSRKKVLLQWVFHENLTQKHQLFFGIMFYNFNMEFHDIHMTDSFQAVI